ncbi:hypothetical protein [Solicola gregarius]|uniref:Uncharacterized protein n=1 Tax=Solicola gregarius TaxID=2908642 RepID=A0AA46YNL0_9ACTN|nr:hypothetical protein [Solicola gregarius]UYM06793.1 hypothetical protein L0C25_06885 [Solicola gregarius]
MSPADLRSRITDEISDLPPMRTVVPDVVADGARSQRRRRAASIGLVAAAIVGAVAVGTAGIDLGGDAHQQVAPATNGVAPPATAAPSDNPFRAMPATSNPEEFAHWAAPRFSDALPDDFEDVRVLDRGDGVYDYVTRDADGTQLTFHLEMWSIPKGYPSLDGCAPGHRECAVAPEIDAKAYLAEEELGANPNPPTRGIADLQMRPTAGPKDYDLLLEFTADQDVTVPLSPEEILDLAASKPFDAIWQEYASHGGWVKAGGAFTDEGLGQANEG